MIELTTADGKAKSMLKDEGVVSINEDLIVLMQRQNNVAGDDFTAIFLMGGVPPYAVTETRDEIHAKIKEARKFKLGALN